MWDGRGDAALQLQPGRWPGLSPQVIPHRQFWEFTFLFFLCFFFSVLFSSLAGQGWALSPDFTNPTLRPCRAEGNNGIYRQGTVSFETFCFLDIPGFH